MKTIYKDFDLPRQHLYGDQFNFVPPKAYDDDEIARRRNLPAGELLREYEQKGIRVARHILEILIDDSPNDFKYASDILAPASLNSSWYRYAADAPEIARRRLKLPVMKGLNGLQVSKNELFAQATHRLYQADEAFNIVREAKTSRGHRELSMWLANQSLGNAALDLTALTTEFSGLTRADLQHEMREASPELLGRSRMLAIEVGAHPSLAQLSDVDSPLAVHYRRNAPRGARTAYTQAVEEVL